MEFLMKTTIRHFVKCILALSLFCGIVTAQPPPDKPKAAVYIKGNPQGRDVLRMAVNTFLIKTGMYQMIAVDAIDLLAREHIRQMSGSVSDNDIATLGRDAGAQYVCVVERTELDGISYVTTSMVSVQSKIAEFSDMKELPRGERVISVIERQINAMLGIRSEEEPVSEPTEQPSPSAASYQYVNDRTETGTVKYTSQSPYSSSDNRDSRRSSAPLTPFDPTAVYAFANTNTVNYRDYDDMEHYKNAWIGGIGMDFHRKIETRNSIGGGYFLGMGPYGDDIWGVMLGLEVKNLFWLVKRHLAVPISFGFDCRVLMTDIENKVAAEFINVMSESDKVADTTLSMKMYMFDFTPAIGLQFVINPTVSVYVGYAYNMSIFTYWNAYYRIPGKSYSEDSDEDAFRVPDKYTPLKEVKERFLGVPGTLRLGFKLHTNN
jgi:hypothetical protein